jgi:hypothetical protein
MPFKKLDFPFMLHGLFSGIERPEIPPFARLGVFGAGINPVFSRP